MGIVVCILGFGLCAGPLQAQSFAPSNPPPLAEKAEVRVYRGTKVEIPLRAAGRIPGQLKFLIRSQPEHGSLGEVRLTGRGTAVVEYTHSGDPGNATDGFRFAVQAADSPVSAPAEVKVSIVESPADLRLLPEVVFGEVPVGQTSRAEVVVANMGGTAAVVHPNTESPWRILEPIKREVPPGSRQTWTLEFQPQIAKAYQGEFRIPGLPVTTCLSGTGVEIFRISTRELHLRANAGRKDFLRFQNSGDKPLAWKLQIPEELTADNSSGEILPGREMEVSISASPQIPGSAELVARLEIGGLAMDIPIAVESTPPRLVRMPEGTLDLSKDGSGRLGASLTLSNAGGSPAALKVDLPEGMIVIPDPSTVVLPPGGSHEFRAVVESRELPAQNAFEIQSPGANSLRVPFRIAHEANRSAPRPAGVQNSVNAITVTPEQPTPANPVASPGPHLRNAQGTLRILEQSGTDVLLAWEKLPVPPREPRLEFRTLEFAGEDKPPVQKWHAWRTVRFEPAENSLRISIAHMAPGTARFMRVSATGPEGNRMESEVFRLAVPAKGDALWVVWVILALVGAGLGWLAALLIGKNRRAREQAEAARIRNLESGG